MSLAAFTLTEPGDYTIAVENPAPNRVFSVSYSSLTMLGEVFMAGALPVAGALVAGTLLIIKGLYRLIRSLQME